MAITATAEQATMAMVAARLPSSSFFRRWDAALRRHLGPLLLLAALPAAVDWGGDLVGLWLNTPASRYVTGGLFGVVAGMCLARALARSARGSVGERVKG